MFILDLWGDPWGTPRSPFGHPGEQTKIWFNHKFWLVKGARYESFVLRLYKINLYTFWKPQKVPYPYTWGTPGALGKLVLDNHRDVLGHAWGYIQEDSWGHIQGHTCGYKHGQGTWRILRFKKMHEHKLFACHLGLYSL